MRKTIGLAVMAMALMFAVPAFATDASVEQGGTAVLLASTLCSIGPAGYVFPQTTNYLTGSYKVKDPDGLVIDQGSSSIPFGSNTYGASRTVSASKVGTYSLEVRIKYVQYKKISGKWYRTTGDCTTAPNVATVEVVPIPVVKLAGFYDGNNGEEYLFADDLREACQLTKTPSVFGAWRAHAMVASVYGDPAVEGDLQVRIRDASTRQTLVTLDLPDTADTVLHEEVTAWEYVPTIAGGRTEYLVCVASPNTIVTAGKKFGIDRTPDVESWIRFREAWTNTTAQLGDFGIWLELV